jgi:hypothetical protein
MEVETIAAGLRGEGRHLAHCAACGWRAFVALEGDAPLPESEADAILAERKAIEAAREVN